MTTHDTPTPDDAPARHEGATRARARSSRHPHWRRGELACLLVLVFGLVAVASLARWSEQRQQAAGKGYGTTDETETLSVKPEAVRRASLGFNGIVADWYWMRALQYVGSKAAARPDALQLDNLSSLDLKLLAPLLDAATTLDPQFLAAYEYGAVVLPTVDTEAGVRLLQKGVAANPKAWRLRYHLGYLYWQRQRFQEAGEAYRAAAQFPSAPVWLNVLAVQMQTQGGSRDAARQTYQHLFEQSEDEQLKVLAYKRLLQLRSLDERDALRNLLRAYQARARRCTESWSAVGTVLRAARFPLDAAGAPLDPAGAPYALTNGGCEVELDAHTTILRN